MALRPPRPSTCARPTGPVRPTVHALAGINVTFETRALHSGHGTVRVREVHAHALHGRSGPAHFRTVLRRWLGHRTPSTTAGLTQLRRDRVGFVFQSFNLVPTLTAAENITLPLDLAGTKVDKAWFDYL